MSSFSISEAFGAGFRVIARKPLAVAVWGIIYMLLTLGPFLVVMAVAGPALFAQAAGGAEPDAALLAGPLGIIQPISWIASMAAVAIVFNAIYRAVLQPDDDRAFYMRLGAAEAWQGLVQFVFGILMAIGIIVVIVVVAILFGSALALSGAGGGGGGTLAGIGVVGGLVVLVLVGVLWWLVLRLCLAGPMTLADRTFRLFESWTLTRGQTLKLFALSLLLLVVVIVLYLVLVLLAAAVLGLGIGGLASLASPGALERMFTDGSGLAVAIPPIVLFGVALSAIYGLVMTVVVAPWAEVYRQLSGRTVDADTFA